MSETNSVSQTVINQISTNLLLEDTERFLDLEVVSHYLYLVISYLQSAISHFAKVHPTKIAVTLLCFPRSKPRICQRKQMDILT